MAYASIVIAKPITAYRMVSFALPALPESPADKAYMMPPTIIMITDITPAAVSRVFVMVEMISPGSLGVPPKLEIDKSVGIESANAFECSSTETRAVETVMDSLRIFML